MIELRNITKIYRIGGFEIPALQNTNFKIEQGEFVAIMGPSGSGKSTLMNLIGCLDRPTSGQYLWREQEIDKLSEWKLAEIRNQKIGFVFQNFNLLPRVSALANVEIPLIYSGKKLDRKKEARRALESVNLTERTSHSSNQLSGGEQQRVAIARALINQPELLLADEPTGNLDSRSGNEIMEILSQLNQKEMTIILVTHEPSISSYAHRQIEMRDGKIIKDTINKKEKTVKKEFSNLPLRRRRLNISEFKESFYMAFSSIFVHKLRSFLTMLGIIIGVAAVITMISLGEGAKTQITQRISNLGANLLMIRPGAPRRGPHRMRGSSNFTSLTFTDAQAIKELCRSVENVAPSYSRSIQIVFGNKNTRTTVRGVTPEFLKVRNFSVDRGRFFNDREERQMRRLAVLGKTVIEELFDKENPLGNYIKLNRVNFQVIGTTKEKGASGWMDEDNVIFVPLKTAQKRLFGINFVSNIDVAAISQETMKNAEKEINEVLKRQHKIKSEDETDFHIRSQADILSTVESTTRTFTLLLAGIAAVSLIVGGIGIMNIMLVSVTERTREIGIRKALGGQRRDILGQFLVEAAVLSLSGGVIGILLGAAASGLTSKIAGWPTLISLASVFLASGFALAIGIFFGFWPARKASLLNPIEALRYE